MKHAGRIEGLGLAIFLATSACGVAPAPAASPVEIVVSSGTALPPVAAGPAPTSAPSSLPSAKPPVDDLSLLLGVELHAGGEVAVDGEKLLDDDAVFTVAKKAVAKNPELRAVIRADTSIQFGRVIRVLDLLKQAGISKIAFGVSPTPAPGTAPPQGATAPPHAGPTPSAGPHK